MTVESSNSDKDQRQNRRFLVSIWQRRSKAETAIDGVVWEADPKLPGRLAEPASFRTLGDLPAILQSFLTDEGPRQ